jgi:hypothetical protein
MILFFLKGHKARIAPGTKGLELLGTTFYNNHGNHTRGMGYRGDETKNNEDYNLSYYFFHAIYYLYKRPRVISRTPASLQDLVLLPSG